MLRLALSGIRLLILVSTILSSSFIQAQTHTPITTIVNSNCGGYWEYLPVNYNPANRYPTIVYLHGAGSYGSGSTSALQALLTNEGIPYYINHGQFPTTFTVNGETSSFICISPQFRQTVTPNDVKTAIDYVLAHYPVDTTRLYLTGYSVGGDFAWKAPFNLANASRLAALAPVAGYNIPYVDTTAQFIAGANLPVWTIHSNNDAAVPYNNSLMMVNKINSFNPLTPAIITQLNGVTHDNTVLVAYDPTFKPNGKNMYEWFLQYRRNKPPIAKANNDTTITMPANTINLSAVGSSDPEGGALTYNWSKLSGPSIFNIPNPSAITTTATNLIAGIYNFKLAVTDNVGLVSFDTVKVTVINPNPNQLPVANAGNDQTINLPATTVSLSGSASTDAGGNIETYAWTKIAGPASFNITSPSSVNTTVTGLKAGVYRFQLQVTDNESGTSKDTVEITVINPFPNQLPVARAGNDQTIALPVTSVSLSGAASSDADGVIIAYAWRQITGPNNSSLSTPNQVTTNASGLAVGTYQFELQVTDDSSAIAKDTVVITVTPVPQKRFVQVNVYGGVAPAGTGWNNWNVVNSLNSSAFTYLDGGASAITAQLSANTVVADNGTGYPTTMCPTEVGRTASWTQANRTLVLSGLDNNKKYDIDLYASRVGGNPTKFTVGTTSITINTNNNYTNKATFTNLTPSVGKITVSIELVQSFTYINGFTLTENSFGGPVNTAPTAVVGSNQTITLPSSQVALSGSGSFDSDGTIASYLWKKTAGPSTYSFSDSTIANPNVTGLTTAGIYTFQLTVTDNGGATGSASMQVTVNPANTPPLVTDSINCGKAVKIVVLGSSTAQGTGASVIDSAWVNKLRAYVLSKNPNSSVLNLGLSGMTTYQILCPNGFVPPANRPSPMTGNNITYALSQNPDVIIINLPSNDAANDYTLQEIQDNYERTMALANARNIPVWVATSQPRNALTAAEMNVLVAQRDWINQRFAEKAIDFWTTVANADGTINTNYNYDGIHVNNLGHDLFYRRTVSERILDTMCYRLNNKPVVNAGVDVARILPNDSVQLSGSAIDSDGSIVSNSWSQLSGPTGYTISSTTITNPKLKGLTVGTYLFELKATDNLGAVGRDTMQITVSSPAPVPPVARAGSDIVTKLPKDSVQLSGSTSSDPDGTIAAYSWRKVSTPAGDASVISDITAANPKVFGLSQGVYVFELMVTDAQSLTAKDSVMVTVNPPNQLPIAKAGNDVAITAPANTVQLNANQSSDPDGNITTYNWSKLSGPANNPSFAINNISVVNPTLSGLIPGVYAIKLQVTDNDGGSSYDTVNITVNPPLNTPPVARAGIDQNISLPKDSVTLSGSGSTDAVGTIISYQWRQLTGPTSSTIVTAGAVSTVVRGLNAGTYTYELLVTDDSTATGRDTVAVIVSAAPPAQRLVQVNVYGGVAPAGTGWNNWNVVNSLNSTAFSYVDGGASTITGALSANTVVADNGAGYPTTMCPTEVGRTASWTQSNRTLVLSGLDNNKKYDIELYASRVGGNPTKFTVGTTSVTINTNSNYTNKAVFTNITPTAGKLTVNIDLVQSFTYINGFTLTEYSSGGTPVNQPPVARAGNDVSITLPVNSVQLDGTTSSDPDGNIASYAWAKLATSPASFSINNASTGNPVISNLTAGVYAMELTVTDNNGATAKDTVNVTVIPAANIPPVARAGNDTTVNLPLSTGIQLNGGASSDADGNIASYAWVKLPSSPASFTISNANIVNPVISNLSAGVYAIQLTVTDNNGAAAKDTINITVIAAPNVPPIARAGSDATITLPVNSIQLSGSTSSDPDGNITTYAWTKLPASPASFAINNASTANPVISSLTAGVYSMQLVVTDNSGATAKDTVNITVNPPLNTPPVARAGSDQNISLPKDSVTLSGSGSSDAVGTIIGYQWRQLTGPTTSTIVTPGAVSTVVRALNAGTYTYELLVTDDSTATGRDTVAVIVSAAPPAQRLVQVNVYGGVAPAGTGWNNWNVVNSLNSTAFTYADGGASTIAAQLSANTVVADNGAGYPTTMCPTEVGRTASWTQTNRTLVLSGLDNSKNYNIDLYASRIGGNPVKFTIGTTSITINTNNNYTSKATFTNLVPAAGKITVNLELVQSFTYINGFTLTENTPVTGRMSGTEYTNTNTDPVPAITTAPSSNNVQVEIRPNTQFTNRQQGSNAMQQQVQPEQQATGVLTVYPNPFRDKLQLQLVNTATGTMKVNIVNEFGQTIKVFQFVKNSEWFSRSISVGDLPKGIYFIQVQVGEFRQGNKLVRM